MSVPPQKPCGRRIAAETLKGEKVMNRVRVLVIDDEPDLLELVQYNLHRDRLRRHV